VLHLAEAKRQQVVEWLHRQDAERVLQLVEAKHLQGVERHQQEEEPLAPVVAQLEEEELVLRLQKVPNQQNQL
jgi:hypothetical protein